MKKVLNGLFVLASLWCGTNVKAQEQKPALDHSVYKIWQNVGGFQLTDDGKYASYLTNVGEGDGSVSVVNLKTSETTTVNRGSRAKFSGNGKYMYFTIRPFFEQTKEAKQKKLRGDKAPKDTLGILNLKTKEIVKFPALKRVESPREMGDFIAFNIEVDKQEAATDSVADKKKKKAKSKKEILTLVYDFKKGEVTDTLRHIDVMAFDKYGKQLFCIAVDSTKQLFVYNPATRSSKMILEAHKKADMQRPVISDDGNRIAFYANTDSTKKFDENVEIYTCRMNVDEPKPVKVITNEVPGLPQGMLVSKNRAINFSKKGDKLFFGITYPIAKKDTTIKEEQAQLDVWHYQAPYIATQDLHMKSMLQKRSYLSVVELDTLDYSLKGKMVRLATEQYPIPTVPDEWSAGYAYTHTSQPYLVQAQWDANPIGDLYIISLKDGSSRLLAKGSYVFGMHTSPSGDYLVWFNPEDNQYYSMDMSAVNKGEDIDAEIKPVNISKGIPHPLWKESHDKPQMAGPYGNGGWSEDEKMFCIYDKYDVWAVDPKGERAPEMLTQGLGREKEYTFRMMRWDAMQLPDGTPGVKKTPIKSTDNIYFTAFDNKTKGTGYYMRKAGKGKWQPMKELIMEPNFQLGYLHKAKNANVITYAKSNFVESQNLWVTFNQFKTSKKLTHSNPQQKDYNWGTCESVYWKAYDGRELEGLLYKPENFDPDKKYPMVVYFYETSSQYKHYYRKPDVSRSTINITYFVSNGYLVFMPDIHYTVGHPGKSAYNCIVSGVENLCKNSWVDKDNIAIQGQSWGGYQVAYLVTQTNMFKCAGSGAPVANMTSAYGGIRWGSGVVRQFQYEHTQSRIGKTLWDEGGFDLYIENSPLFFADKVNTPLLIMHNDKDEAVPWYQGIEYFTALRRLGKPVWMLQYNNETHNLSNRVNALDYTIRLSQFMDHFLKGAPMPKWMKYGVPSTMKGIDYGLELVEE
ncbi:MAG: S9 family peptidase [Bacteroides sp.]|nr:S9 family peptidase [Bacteroides sp.]